MSGALPPLPQYAFMAWCSVKVQGQLYTERKRKIYKERIVKNYTKYGINNKERQTNKAKEIGE
jgi:hypothetical protein